MKKFLFGWLLISFIVFWILFLTDFLIDFNREYKKEGRDYFTELRLESSNVNICGDRTQINTLYMRPIYDLIVNYSAQLLRKSEDGSYTDVRGAVLTGQFPALVDQYKNSFERDYRDLNGGHIQPGEYKWHTNGTFTSRTGQKEEIHYEGNDFIVFCFDPEQDL